MRHVGLLTVRNEFDVVEQFLRNAVKYFTDIVVMDDSTDGTFERLSTPKKKRFIKHLVKFSDIYDPTGPRTDGQKQYLLEFILRSYGPGTWVTILNADAFFGDDPNRAVEVAERERKTQVHWCTYNFYPCEHDEPDYIADPDAWLALPVQQRLRWFYHHQFKETLQFKLASGMKYNVKRHHRIIPDGLDPKSVASILPVLLHYPLRSPGQIVARRDDRLLTGFRKDSYYQPFIEHGGFVRPDMPMWPYLKRWDDAGIQLPSF